MDSTSREKDLSRQTLLRDNRDAADGCESEASLYDEDFEFSKVKPKPKVLDWLHIVILLGYLPLILLNVTLHTKSRNGLAEQSRTHPDLIDCALPSSFLRE